MSFFRRHDTQHNDIQQIDIQHNDTQHNNIQHNGTQQNDTQHNGKAMSRWVSFKRSVLDKPFMLSDVMLNVIILTVVGVFLTCYC